MSDERAPLSRLFHTEDSRARVNCADGVPEHLRDHLRVPDKEVFVLQARLLALQTALASTESDRDEALRVAADATARCDSFEERAASRLDKARTRAATAERAAEASERRADEGERQVAVLERRVGEVEASLVATRGVAEGARFRLETKVTQNASLEVDITVLHQRVRLLERGVLSVSFGTQTAAEDFAAAARANDADKVLPAAVGVRANAKRWLQELQAVGAPPSVDTVSGLPLRANARHHLTPPGLGTDLVPPSAPDKGAAGYTKAHAVRAMSRIVEHDIIPAVETMFCTKLPTRVEIKALLEEEVLPCLEWYGARRKGAVGIAGDERLGGTKETSHTEFNDELSTSTKRSKHDRSPGTSEWDGESVYDDGDSVYGDSVYAEERVNLPQRRGSGDRGVEPYDGWGGDDAEWTLDAELTRR